ncbi:mitochondrial carrier protein-like protein [Calycina marina]|uniref:Mitochondrial carrier protein-like protein n=1 Tax=Calycina marina TaxID=1763456 RepID=A0A9P7Z4C5_9HELO|nr:mitochondrial carrier protein-like protein [Calycina marina]
MIKQRTISNCDINRSVDLLVYPLDTLKTRFQSPHYKKIYYDASKNAINRKVLFRGLYQGIGMYSLTGYGNLLQGDRQSRVNNITGSVVLITIPSSGAFFTTYEAVKSGLEKTNAVLSGSSKPFVPQPFIHSFASSVAELVSCFILTPAEVLKQNAQMARRPDNPDSTIGAQKSATIEALKKFKRPSQLFRGYTALAARNLPFTAMQFPMYEQLKSTLINYRKDNGTFTGAVSERAWTTSISAGSAGSVAAVITTPVDVVKTRIMLSAAGESSEAAAKQKLKREGRAIEQLTKRKGGLTVAREVFQESGMRGLFRGGTLRAAWTALGSGLYLGVYESGKLWLEDERKRL